MNWRSTGRHDGIRRRLGLALVVALAPVLVLSGLQSALIFHKDAADKRGLLVGAARRSALGVHGTIGETAGLLRELATSTPGFQCVQRLADVKARMHGILNLVRVNSAGWVTCAAAPVSLDVSRQLRESSTDLARGGGLSIRTALAQGGATPAVLVAVPEFGETKRPAGAMAAVISAENLVRTEADRAPLADSAVALADAGGRFVASPNRSLFPPDPSARLRSAGVARGGLWLASDGRGEERLLAAAPLAGDLFVVLSAPSEGLVSWARLNPLSAFVLPVLAFLVALAAVSLVAERGVVRWILYLRRIARLYAGGRYGVRPTKADAAPAEIRELAAALGHMAETLTARDAAIRESLAAKDRMMREIHHRVKNNLQVISSLLNLQQRTLHDDIATSAIRDTRQRILALAVIYRALYEGPDLSHIDLSDFVHELVAQLLVENTDLPTRTEVRTAPLNIDPDRLAPLALFIVEAVANVRRLPKGGADRALGIRFARTDGQGELLIVDGAPRLEQRDLGGTLMKVFARQLGGDITYPDNLAGGQDARLVFPLNSG